ncbi:S8 family serine peptidase [Geodermatophilus sp. SYSU D01119]
MSTLSRRTQAAVLVSAVVVGYAGAAAYTALAAPALPVAEDFGPGDGLDRYVVTAESGDAAALLGPLEALDGVATAQRLSDGRALVAADGLGAADLASVDGVSAVEFSPPVPVFGTVTDPYGVQYGWNLENTGTNAYNQAAVADADSDAPDAWDVGTGAGTVVAVVDTGFDSDHEDLAGALWTNPAEPCGTVDADRNGKAGDCHGWNFVTNSADVDNGSQGTHGTNVSGTIGARAGNGRGIAGVAPDATIMPLVIGSGSGVDAYLGAEAIRYAADHGADVVNASWGGQFTGSAYEAVRSAIAYAGSKGVLVVAAAGNDAGNRDTNPVYPASYTEPNLVTVGSSTAADTGTPSSAYGATSVDLFAPGNLVATTWNDGGYRLVGGTSIAAPHVAAALALYRAAMPAATIAELTRALLEDTDPVAAFRGRSVSGGRLSLTGLAERVLDSVDYTFTGMSAPAGVVSPAVAVSGTTAPGTFSVTLGLGMQHEGEVWAVSGAEIGLDGATVTTGDDGLAVFSLGARTSLDGLTLRPSAALGDGRYVLTVQLTRDGAALGGTRAAPLLVGAAAEAGPDRPADGSGTGDSGTGGSGTGGSGTGGSGTGGSGTGGSGTGGSGTGGSGTGGSGTGGSGTGGSGTPGDGAQTPDTDNGSGTGGSGTGGSGTGGSGTPGDGAQTPDTDNGSGTGGSGTGGSGTGGTPPSSGTGGTPPSSGSGTVTYPTVGQFRITSITPVTVGVSGGTRVRVNGLALPPGARVRIGDSAAATVVRSNTTSLVFTTPARVAGRYDVTVFAPDGRSQVLEDVLEYVAAPAAGAAPAPDGGSGSATPPSGGSGTAPGGTAPGGGTQPGGGTAPDGGTTPGGGTAPGGTAPGGGSAAPGTRTGPDGQRLVYSARLGGIPASLWAMDCSVSCRGLVVGS